MRLHVEGLGMILHLEESGNEATWGQLSTYPGLIPIPFHCGCTTNGNRVSQGEFSPNLVAN